MKRMSKENSLFKEATIKRLISNVNITAKHKKAVNKWLDYFRSGKLENEKQAYIEFANIILRDLLDYDISLEGLKHEEENIEFLFKKNGNNLICFEAKGAKTKDLWAYQGRDKKSRETPVNQINSYMYDKVIPFGILTNYRLFVLFDRNEGSKKYHLIDFTELIKEEKLKEFIALFSREQVEKGFITEVIQQSIVEEREFTKEFYKLYHETRLMLIKEFEDNSGISREASVHFAQLYLNRLMFVFFAEDTGKIDKRIIEDRIIKTLDNIHLFSSNSSNISNVLVGLFNDLDKGSDFPVKLFGFNGGLFKHPIPPKIFFKDFRDDKFFKDVNQYSKLKKKELELNDNEQVIFNKYKNKLSPIIKNVLLMASFDFNSEVNVNILGHIFEQSISDIEDLKTEKSSRRKKEGIFYTPEYITDYICRNTIITYLSKKGINSVPELIKEYAENIEELEEKFKSIKILDPACGSGAFLIKATDIMLEIFKAIQEFKQSEGEYEAKKGLKKKSNSKGQLVLEKWNEEAEAREIIESSIHGVDINEESVEITKLSLFLKMARKNRKLTDLSNNIKRGNSLINDSELAGELAFDWDKEFPFKFDVVIGNPPYVRQERFTEIKPYLENNYEVYSGVADLYSYFYEKGVELLKEGGFLGFISSNKWMKVKYGLGLRKFLKTKQIIRIIDFFELKVFEDASTEPIIVVLSNQYKSNNKINVALIEKLNFDNFYNFIDKNTTKINQDELDDDGWNLSQSESKEIISKMKEDSISLGKFVNKKIYSGIKTGANHILVINKEKYDELLKKDNNSKQIIKPLIEGTEIGEYTYNLSDKYLILSKKGTDIEKYSAVKEYLLEFKKELAKRSDIVGKGKWFELRQCAYYDEFEKTKIVYIHTARRHKFSLDGDNNYLINNCYFINSSSLYLLAYLNSKLFEYYKINTFVAFGDAKDKGRCKLDYNKMVNVPIKPIDESTKKQFEEVVNRMIILKNDYNQKISKFFNRIKKSFNLEKLNNKIHSFYELEFNDFVKEIEKLSKKKLSLKEQDEWEDYFNEYKKDLLSLKDKIEKTDSEINKMVYKLYGLSKDEIQIIEESMK